MRNKLMILLVALLLLVPVIGAQVNAVLSYNGTVILDFQTREWIYVPANWTLITTQGVTRSGNYISPMYTPAQVQFKVKTQGILSIDEPNVSKVTVLLPLNSRITYMEPVPSSLIQEGNELNITFDTGNVTIAYYLVDQNVFTENPYVYSTAVSSGITAYLGYLLFRRRPSPQLVQSNDLDDRDIKILEAIKSGADNLNKISEVSLLPRTTVYRRVKRLVNMGMIEEIREKGKVRYVAKGGTR
ncbi:helix-turn-helix transcriptional regulator [Metallosphaera hakonensis]|uniref:Transcriptional regulator n=2 Tax=Metallosphaera hakonensis TaxID=79601 RepID=A0A2U9ISM2_9CREN|nr:helix-turn-helix domain-containing protein [Metallosphaera hakonensis]AWR98953.1 winged helix-turn-helix transcriptional regulator [Metallosphaera hakonensis JCM 8857 = DSM 7519]